jgi:hypothetical protein
MWHDQAMPATEQHVFRASGRLTLPGSATFFCRPCNVPVWSRRRQCSLFPSHSGLLSCFFLFSLCQSSRGRQGRSHDGQAQESRSQQAWPWAQRIHPLLQLWPLSAQGEQRRCRLSSGCKAPLPFGAEMSGQDGCAVTLRAGYRLTVAWTVASRNLSVRALDADRHPARMALQASRREIKPTQSTSGGSFGLVVTQPGQLRSEVNHLNKPSA